MGRCTRQCVERPMTNAGVSTAYQLPSTKGASHGLRTTTRPMRRPTNGGALHRRCAFKPNLTVPPFRNLPRTQQPAQHDIQTTNMPPELSMLAPVTHDRFERLQRQYGSDLTLAVLVDDCAGRLPLPGSGETLKRWQALATVAAHDLSLVKLFEGHTDALAILEELGGDAPSDGSLWATWCAELRTLASFSKRTETPPTHPWLLLLRRCPRALSLRPWCACTAPRRGAPAPRASRTRSSADGMRPVTPALPRCLCSNRA